MRTPPPNGEYTKPFNSTDAVHTADGVQIRQGLRVFTNNLDRGTVDLGRANYEWHPVEGRYVLWFDVLLDTSYKGVPTTGRELQSDDRVATRFDGKKA